MAPASLAVAEVKRLFAASLLHNNGVKRIPFAAKKLFCNPREATHIFVFPRIGLACAWLGRRRSKKIFIMIADEKFATQILPPQPRFAVRATGNKE